MIGIFLRSIGLASVAIAGSLTLASQGIAGPITYGCTAGADCDGNQYALSVISHVGNTYQLELDIKVLNTYTGNQWTDVVESVATKDFIPSFSNFSLISAPGSVSNWVLVQNELNDNGCAGGSVSGELCTQAAGTYPDSSDPISGGYLGAALTGPGQILSWVFQFDSADAINSLGHIKYEYEDTAGNKVGSLGSWDIAIQSGGGGGGGKQGDVPEPASLAALGTALVAFVGFVAVRRRRWL